MVKNFNKRLCCALCTLVNLFSASKKTESISFRDICRSSAKGTATVVRHVTSWIMTAISGVSMVCVFQNNSTTKEKINFCVLYTSFAALGILNTCDMIYEHIESKNQETKKTSENDNKTVNKGESKRS